MSSDDRSRWIASLTAAKQIAEARGRVDLATACQLKLEAVRRAPGYELHNYQPGVDMLVADATDCTPLSALRARRAALTPGWDALLQRLAGQEAA